MVLKFESLFVQVIVLFCCSAVVHCIIYPTVSWTPENPAFAKNYSLSVEAYSQITLQCPNPATVLSPQDHSRPSESMYENIWLVDKQGYETCTVDSTNPRHRSLKVCNTPSQLSYYVIVFQLFSPSNELQFQQGNEYYLISTSSGSQSSLDDKSGGHCQSNNMRLKFYVCYGRSDSKCQSSKPKTAAQIVPSVTTVTKTVTYCPPMTISPIQPAKLIKPSPSTSAAVSNTVDTQSFVLPNVIQSRYASILSSIKPSTSQSQSSTTKSGFVQTPVQQN